MLSGILQGNIDMVRQSYHVCETMTKIAITRMSSKGQIVIPKTMREGLSLHTGDVFALFGEEDTLILKKVAIPDEDELESLLKWGRDFAKERDITRQDVEKAIAEAREDRKGKN